jgi:hypothetical protein
MTATGYFDSPWPAEDGGPKRLAAARGTGLAPRQGETLRQTSRGTLMSTMPVLGGPGEVFVLTHTVLEARLGLPTHARVERIDPVTLKAQKRSPVLRGGPMWPGGMAVHRNGDLYVVYGRYAHRLSRECEIKASLKLPVNEAYNSFVILDSGQLVAKNLSDSTRARIAVIDPETLRLVCEDVECPEPSIARLSAVGDCVYVVGTESVFRYVWDQAGGTLRIDDGWRFRYKGEAGQTYGWDCVLDGADVWFMDNGKHRYRTSMIGAGVSAAPNRLLRVSMQDAHDWQAIDVSGVAGGSVTNPPLVDVARKIVVGFDSANRHLAAWRFSAGHRRLEEIWRREAFGAASHMVLWPETGEIAVNDYRKGEGEHVVLLDIESGAERGRVNIGGFTQGVVFPAPGWSRDVYWCSMSRLARVFVEEETPG